MDEIHRKAVKLPACATSLRSRIRSAFQRCPSAFIMRNPIDVKRGDHLFMLSVRSHKKQTNCDAPICLIPNEKPLQDEPASVVNDPTVANPASQEQQPNGQAQPQDQVNRSILGTLLRIRSLRISFNSFRHQHSQRIHPYLLNSRDRKVRLPGSYWISRTPAVPKHHNKQEHQLLSRASFLGTIETQQNRRQATLTWPLSIPLSRTPTNCGTTSA